jgi:hypothetical protein
MDVRQAAKWRRKCTTTATSALAIGAGTICFAAGVAYALIRARSGRPGKHGKR